MDDAVKDFPAEKKVIRMTKVGRYFYVLMYLIVSSRHKTQSVDEMDAVRKKAYLEVKDLHPALVMDVLFTRDEIWAK